MDARGREKRVTVNVDEWAINSTDLARRARGRQVVEQGAGKCHTATIYYDTVAEARELYTYLVRNAPCDDKVAWQQDRAHLEIRGWCRLCEAANHGECHGWCLLDLTSKENAGLPSFWFPDCQDKNNENE
jgi:hypothetical protein